MSVILADATVVTMNPGRDILDRGSVLVRGDRIAGIGTIRQLAHENPDAEIVDCDGGILFPVW